MQAALAVETLRINQESTSVVINERVMPQRLKGLERVTAALPSVVLPIGEDGNPIRNLVKVTETSVIPGCYQSGDGDFCK